MDTGVGNKINLFLLNNIVIAVLNHGCSRLAALTSRSQKELVGGGGEGKE